MERWGYLVIGQWIRTRFVGMIAAAILEFVVEDAVADGGGIQVSAKDLSSGPDGVVHASSGDAPGKPTEDNRPDSSAVGFPVK